MVGLNPDSLIVCPRAEDFLLTDSHMMSWAEEICRHDVILCILFAMGGESCHVDTTILLSRHCCRAGVALILLFCSLMTFLLFRMFVLGLD